MSRSDLFIGCVVLLVNRCFCWLIFFWKSDINIEIVMIVDIFVRSKITRTRCLTMERGMLKSEGIFKVKNKIRDTKTSLFKVTLRLGFLWFWCQGNWLNTLVSYTLLGGTIWPDCQLFLCMIQVDRGTLIVLKMGWNNSHRTNIHSTIGQSRFAGLKRWRTNRPGFSPKVIPGEKHTDFLIRFFHF